MVTLTFVHTNKEAQFWYASTHKLQKREIMVFLGQPCIFLPCGTAVGVKMVMYYMMVKVFILLHNSNATSAGMTRPTSIFPGFMD